ncbi:MAG: sugar phosphate isomerase/epimerase [Oscillospiraceae bacterium]|nr:sugar phosphate isomerase/epimerase [Oscillospiraceae bacterium]
MRVGAQTCLMQEIYSPDRMFQMISEAGLDCVDFNINDFVSNREIFTNNATPLYDGSLDEARAILRPYKDAAAKHGVGFYQTHAPFPTIAENPRMLQVIRRCLEACAYLECPYLVVHPSFPGYRERKNMENYDEWASNIDFFSELIPTIKETGVRVCLENMFTGYNGRKMEAICSDMGEAVRYIDALNGAAGFDAFGFCLDTGHAMLFAKDQRKAINELGPRLFALHLNDNDGYEDQHYAPYMGAVDWDAVTAGLRDVGYGGALCFEIGGSYKRVDPAMLPALLRFTAAAGNLFWEKVHG